jgi:CheY-like chemotaxis protein/HPt (histidine-containing phosphotransfer) domain-containing protein
MLASDTQPGDAARGREVRLSGIVLKPVARTQLLRIVCEAMRIATCGAGEPAVPPPVREPGYMSALRILVAEDSPDNRLLIQAYLKGTPYKITFVEDGRRAIEEFSAGEFDLILMDMQMPVMDGLSATRAIRGVELERRARRTPILALTANARPRDMDASHAAGCDGHFSKPISKQRLLEAIDSHARISGRAPGGEVAEAITVAVPPGFEELLPGYLAARRQDVPEMLRLLAASDFDHLCILAHNMKGSGASYGFSGLTDLGAAMEQAAKQRDNTALNRHLAELRQYLDRVQVS